MASRMRGMTVLSSTIIPRVQRLLETGVLKERPVWLDAVEAVPPLPPPTLPEAHKTGSCLNIVYPQDKLREEDENMKSVRRRGQNPPISLFESRVVKGVPQWRRTIAVMNFPPPDVAPASHREATESELAEKTREHSTAPLSDAAVIAKSDRTSEEADVAPELAETSDEQTHVPISDAELVSASGMNSVAKTEREETTDEQYVPLSGTDSWHAGSEWAGSGGVRPSSDAASEAESISDAKHEQAKDDEQPTITVYVDMKGREKSEDNAIELSELLKKYEK